MKAYILIGPPGSGKSFWRDSFLKDNPDYVVVSSDDYIDEYASLHGKTYSEVFQEAISGAVAHCNAKFHSALNNNQSMIIDRTNMSIRARAEFLNKLENYQKIAMIFNVERTVLNTRLENRAKATGKTIPEFVIDNMLKNYQEPSLQEFDFIHYM